MDAGLPQYLVDKKTATTNEWTFHKLQNSQRETCTTRQSSQAYFVSCGAQSYSQRRIFRFTKKRCTLRKQEIVKFKPHRLQKKFGNWSQKTLNVSKQNAIHIKSCACNEWVWNFNLQNHYSAKHSRIQPGEEDKTVMNEIEPRYATEMLSKILRTESRDGIASRKLKRETNKKLIRMLRGKRKRLVDPNDEFVVFFSHHCSFCQIQIIVTLNQKCLYCLASV